MTMETKTIEFFPKQYEALTFTTQFGLVVAGVQCIEETEYIYTANGIKQIKELKNNDKILGGIVKNIHQFETDIYEVTFNNGIKIKTNIDHPFYCKTRSGKERWIKLEEIIKFKELRKKEGILGYFYKSNEFNDFSKNRLITPKLLGYLLSDGSWSNTQSLKFTNINRTFIEEVRVSAILFSKDIKPKLYEKGNGWDLLLTTGDKGKRNPLKSYLTKLKASSNDLGEILNADKNYLIEFIKGYFNGDGYLTIDKNRKENRKNTALIAFCIGINEKLAKQVQYILWKLGINSHIRKEWHKKSTQHFFRLVVDRNSTQNIIDILDHSKYPEKFNEAKEIKQEKARNFGNWISIKKITKIGKGTVVGWETQGTNEIISYCGMKTHNSGKSHMGACWAAGKMQEKEESVGSIIAPSYKLLQQSTLAKFFGIFPQFRAFYKEQKGIIQIDNKTIYIRSADNPLSLEGMTLDWAWLDEAGMMPRLVWSVIRSRVSITKGQVLLTTTPYSLNWIYEEFYLPWKRKEDKSLSFYTWVSTENPKFSKEIFEAEKKRLPPEEFARRYCGQFKKMEGLVYNFETIERKPFPKNVQYICGVDWGFSNPAAIVIIAIVGKQFYVVDEWKETEKTTAEIIEVLANFISIYDIKYVYPDPAEPDRIKELSMSHIESQPVTKDIKGGISYIQQLIKEKRIAVFNSCQNFMDEANSYHYPTNRISDIPVKSNDHLQDSARYCLFSYHLDKKEDATDEIISG